MKLPNISRINSIVIGMLSSINLIEKIKSL